MADIGRECIQNAYEEVRNDSSDTNWAFVVYDEDDKIVLESTGVDYKELLEKFQDDIRAFAFVRIMVGDEMSFRPKFVLITWIGQKVEPMKRAKVSTDKGLVKKIFQSCSRELQTSDMSDLEEELIRPEGLPSGQDAEVATPGDDQEYE